LLVVDAATADAGGQASSVRLLDIDANAGNIAASRTRTCHAPEVGDPVY
jgi:hypothetical protein